MKWRSDRYIIAIVILALLCRLGLLVVSGHLPALQNLLDVGDAVGYEQLARSLLESGSYRFATGGPTAFRMPGYPVFLALIYSVWDSHLAVRLVQILLDGVTVWLTWATARKITDRRIVWYLAPAFVAMHPLLMVISLMLVPETTTTTFLVAAVWILIQILDADAARWRRLVALLFFLLTFGIYLKPTVASVSLFVALVLFLFALRRTTWKRSLEAVAVVSIVTMLTLSPWVTRNWVTMEAFVPLTTSSGTNLDAGNNSDAKGGYVFNRSFVLPGMSEVESNAALTQRALDWIRANPTQFLALLPQKAIRHWSPVAFHVAGALPLPRALHLVVILLFALFYLMVLLGCRAMLQCGLHWKVVVLLSTPFGLFLPSLIASGATRFALPSFPQLAILAAMGVAWLRQKVRPFSWTPVT